MTLKRLAYKTHYKIHLDPMILRADSLSYSSLLVALSVCGNDVVDPNKAVAVHTINIMTICILNL